MFAVVDTTDATRKETAMMKPGAATTLLLSLLTLAAPARAQTSTATTPGFEVLVPSGTMLTTGAQDAERPRANVTALQLSYGLRPDIVLTSTVGWAQRPGSTSSPMTPASNTVCRAAPTIAGSPSSRSRVRAWARARMTTATSTWRRRTT